MPISTCLRNRVLLYDIFFLAYRSFNTTQSSPLLFQRTSDIGRYVHAYLSIWLLSLPLRIFFRHPSTYEAVTQRQRFVASHGCCGDCCDVLVTVTGPHSQWRNQGTFGEVWWGTHCGRPGKIKHKLSTSPATKTAGLKLTKGINDYNGLFVWQNAIIKDC